MSTGRPPLWPKVYRWLLLTGLAFVVSFLPLLFYGAAAAAAPSAPAVQVSVAPARVEIAQAGEEFAVEVTVSQVNNLKGADVIVRFDPSIVQPLAVRPADLLAGRDLLGPITEVNGQEGYVSFATALTGEQAVTGQGSLIRLSFRAEHEGVTAMTIAKSELVDKDVQYMPVEVSHGQVLVGVSSATPGAGTSPGSLGIGQGSSDTSGGQGPSSNNAPEEAATDSGPAAAPSTGGPVTQGPGSLLPGAAGETGTPATPSAGSSGQPSAEMLEGRGEPASVAAGRFADVTADSWFAEAVGVLAARGIVTGYEDKTFRPQQPVSRAEFAVLVARALGLEPAEFPQSAPGFADAAQIPSWAQKEVVFLAANGIIQGDMGSNFRPQDHISRAEITAILIRALGLEEQAREVGEASGFIDLDQVQWAKGYISLASRLGMVKGYPGGEFRPQAQASRAEASQMLVNLLRQAQGR